ncbi:hypothetical protein Areg01_87960 [Actinoplanes regularis]|nr:hypothetical protein Areg01_87960 [Actinoplanes regularis]
MRPVEPTGLGEAAIERVHAPRRPVEPPMFEVGLPFLGIRHNHRLYEAYRRRFSGFPPGHASQQGLAGALIDKLDQRIDLRLFCEFLRRSW